jgi:hypothetical protein
MRAGEGDVMIGRVARGGDEQARTFRPMTLDEKPDMMRVRVYCALSKELFANAFFVCFLVSLFRTSATRRFCACVFDWR